MLSPALAVCIPPGEMDGGVHTHVQFMYMGIYIVLHVFVIGKQIPRCIASQVNKAEADVGSLRWKKKASLLINSFWDTLN